MLSNIRKGANILFSVPNFNSASHVRYFTSEEEVKSRYEKWIDIKEMYRFRLSTRNVIYMGKGTIK